MEKPNKNGLNGSTPLHPFRKGEFCPPNSTTIKDTLFVLFIHMLPFTPFPLALTFFLLWKSYLSLGPVGVASYVAILTILTIVPTFYVPTIRQAVVYPIYMPLAKYVPSCKWVAPSTPFPADKTYIFGCHPHGRMFYSHTLLWQLYNIPLNGILTRGEVFITAADGFFYVPIFRHLFTFLGIISVSKKSLEKKLRKGNHVAIAVGGVKEVLLGTPPDVDPLYLAKRKGFVKLAIEQGAGLVPVYYFNENKLFREDPKWVLALWGEVNKYAAIGVPLMRGVAHLTIPYRRPLLIAIGEPIFPREGESVDALHERYTHAVQHLFDQFVGESPNPKQKLKIY